MIYEWKHHFCALALQYTLNAYIYYQDEDENEDEDEDINDNDNNSDVKDRAKKKIFFYIYKSFHWLSNYLLWFFLPSQNYN